MQNIAKSLPLCTEDTKAYIRNVADEGMALLVKLTAERDECTNEYDLAKINKSIHVLSAFISNIPRDLRENFRQDV